jgi:hypothetical protein
VQFVYTIDPAVLPNVTAEREAYNASLPPDGAPGSSGSSRAVASNEAFLSLQLDELLRAWIGKHKLLPPAPPPPDPGAVPQSCTRKQGLKALARADEPDVGMAAPVFEADIQAVINAMPETTAAERLRKYDMQVEFRDAPTWRKGNVFFESMVTAMRITPEQRDALLKKAATFQE